MREEIDEALDLLEIRHRVVDLTSIILLLNLSRLIIEHTKQEMSVSKVDTTRPRLDNNVRLKILTDN